MVGFDNEQIRVIEEPRDQLSSPSPRRGTVTHAFFESQLAAGQDPDRVQVEQGRLLRLSGRGRNLGLVSSWSQRPNQLFGSDVAVALIHPSLEQSIGVLDV